MIVEREREKRRKYEIGKIRKKKRTEDRQTDRLGSSRAI